MTNEGQQEQYTFGYTSGMDKNFLTRMANREAAFFLPHLREGMDVLDCGCGPGSISIGIAQVISPGHVTGVDIGEEQIDRAGATAKENDINNVGFQVADVYALPFPDESFDAIFANAVLEHLSDPIKALDEMHRVLKTGGFIGVRDGDGGTTIHYPHDPLMALRREILYKVWEHNGGDPFIGRKLRQLLREANFVRIESSASSETPMSRGFAGPNVAESPMADRIIEIGIADRETLNKIAEARQKFSENPDAFMALTFCEAVAWKE